MEIYKAITNIIGDIKAIGKDHKNTFQGYKFRGIDDVYNAVNGLLAKHKVCIFPSYEVISEIVGTTKKGAEQKNVVIQGIYKFVASDGSFEEVTTIGEASDTSDKAYNKAMSTAYKYALFQVFCIPTEEQKDTEHASPEVIKTNDKKLDPELLQAVDYAITTAGWEKNKSQILKKYNLVSFSYLSEEQAKDIINKCNKHKEEMEAKQ